MSQRPSPMRLTAPVESPSTPQRDAASPRARHHGVFGARPPARPRGQPAQRRHRTRDRTMGAAHDGVYRIVGYAADLAGELLAACWAGGTEPLPRIAARLSSGHSAGRTPRSRRDHVPSDGSALSTTGSSCTSRSHARRRRRCTSSRRHPGHDRRAHALRPRGVVGPDHCSTWRSTTRCAGDLTTLARARHDARVGSRRRGRAGHGQFRTVLTARRPRRASDRERGRARSSCALLASTASRRRVPQYEIRRLRRQLGRAGRLRVPATSKIAIEYDSYAEHLGTEAHRSATAHGGTRSSALGWTPITATVADLRNGGASVSRRDRSSAATAVSTNWRQSGGTSRRNFDASS